MRRFLIAGMVAAALCGTALADEIEPAPTLTRTVELVNSKLSIQSGVIAEEKLENVVYTDSTLGNSQCLLMVVCGDPGEGKYKYNVNKDTILYIDQQTAEGNTVTFPSVYPSAMGSSVILMTSTGATEPKILGQLSVHPNLGDPDEDGEIATGDIVYLARAMADNPDGSGKLQRVYTSNQFKAADIDKSDVIDTADLIMLARHIAHLEHIKQDQREG